MIYLIVSEQKPIELKNECNCIMERKGDGSVKLVIPGAFPTMNEIVAASKSHHMAYSKMKKQYTGLVVLFARSQQIPEFGRVNATITWYCKNQRTDKDNVVAGQKFLWDGLVKAGVLKNDGWGQIGDVTHRFDVDKRNPRIEIELREVVG